MLAGFDQFRPWWLACSWQGKTHSVAHTVTVLAGFDQFRPWWLACSWQGKTHSVTHTVSYNASRLWPVQTSRERRAFTCSFPLAKSLPSSNLIACLCWLHSSHLMLQARWPSEVHWPSVSLSVVSVIVLRALVGLKEPRSATNNVIHFVMCSVGVVSPNWSA